MKAKLLGMLVLVASTPVSAGTDGQQLFQQISAEIAQYEARNGFIELIAGIRKSVGAAEIRSIRHHEYTITRYPDLFYDVTGLAKGQHPYHATGDWDCDGRADQAVLLDAPSAQVVVLLGRGTTLAFETDADGITPGEPGRHLTHAGRGHGEGEEAERFTAACGFIHAHYWGKSSFALVVDPEAARLLRFQTRD